MDPLWLTIAFISGFAVKLAGLPPLVGYLAAGFILKFTGAESGPVIEQVSDLGVILLLFTIGLKLKLKDIARIEVFGSASVHLTLVSAVYGIALYLLSFSGLHLFAGLSVLTSALIAFSLGFSSTVYAVKVLEEKGEMQSIHGSLSVGVLIIQDIFAVLFLVFAAGKVPSVWALAVIPVLFLLRPVIYFLLNRAGHGEILIQIGRAHV